MDDELQERIAIMEHDGKIPGKLAERWAKALLIGPNKFECPVAWQKTMDEMLMRFDKHQS